jgi:hypothetical protein
MRRLIVIRNTVARLACFTAGFEMLHVLETETHMWREHAIACSVRCLISEASKVQANFGRESLLAIATLVFEVPLRRPLRHQYDARRPSKVGHILYRLRFIPSPSWSELSVSISVVTSSCGSHLLSC